MIVAWLAIRIEQARPGTRDRGLRRRTLLVPAERTFGQLADALNLALARWDPDGAHTFELEDGRRIGRIGTDANLLDEGVLRVGGILCEGDQFDYRLDVVGVHRCRVLATNADTSTIRDE